jgi:phosphohistidine phosphatase SixA
MKKLWLVGFIFGCLFAHAQSGSIFIVRHAEKASSDRDAVLSSSGLARAECLAATLHDVPVKSILTTEFKRTQQTAEPEAKQAGVSETVVPASDIPGAAAAARKAAVNGDVLVVGHSNTVPQIVQALGGESNPMADTEFDRLTIIRLNAEGKPQVTTLHYCITPSSERKPGEGEMRK